MHSLSNLIFALLEYNTARRARVKCFQHTKLHHPFGRGPAEQMVKFGVLYSNRANINLERLCMTPPSWWTS